MIRRREACEAAYLDEELPVGRDLRRDRRCGWRGDELAGHQIPPERTNQRRQVHVALGVGGCAGEEAIPADVTGTAGAAAVQGALKLHRRAQMLTDAWTREPLGVEPCRVALEQRPQHAQRRIATVISWKQFREHRDLLDRGAISATGADATSAVMWSRRAAMPRDHETYRACCTLTTCHHKSSYVELHISRRGRLRPLRPHRRRAALQPRRPPLRAEVDRRHQQPRLQRVAQGL